MVTPGIDPFDNLSVMELRLNESTRSVNGMNVHVVGGVVMKVG